MSEQYLERGKIAAKASKIEGLLRSLGASGIGLKELGDSYAHELAKDDLRRLRHIYTVRNKAAHEDAFRISDVALQAFTADADGLISILERKLGTPNDIYSEQYARLQRGESLRPTKASESTSRSRPLELRSPEPPQPKASPSAVKEPALDLKAKLKEGAKKAAIDLAVAAVFSVFRK